MFLNVWLYASVGPHTKHLYIQWETYSEHLSPVEGTRDLGIYYYNVIWIDSTLKFSKAANKAMQVLGQIKRTITPQFFLMQNLHLASLGILHSYQFGVHF